MSIKATRMNLLLTKRKLKLAERGHKLLKEKRDALVVEFFDLLKEIKKLREDLGNKLLAAQKKLNRAQAVQGAIDLERLALGTGPRTELELESRSVMGVELLEVKNIETQQEWFGFFESSVELDDAIVAYRDLLPVFLKLVVKQLVLDRLAEEVKKTKRKVNSLEYLIIPDLEYKRDFISAKLEEFERENFIRLKKVKEKAEKAEQKTGGAIK